MKDLLRNICFSCSTAVLAYAVLQLAGLLPERSLGDDGYVLIVLLCGLIGSVLCFCLQWTGLPIWGQILTGAAAGSLLLYAALCTGIDAGGSLTLLLSCGLIGGCGAVAAVLGARLAADVEARRINDTLQELRKVRQNKETRRKDHEQNHTD